MKVVDVDGLVLIVADDEGTEYRVAVDEAALRRLRHSQTSSDSPKVSPREIQSQLRAGLSPEEVSALTGATAEQIERYEGPVLAEKDFIISSAQTVPTQHQFESETGSVSSEFGALIRHRLSELAASGERWATWREEAGNWIIKLEFVSSGIDHDARWSFDPKKRTLQAVNSDAATLSQRGELSTGLIPKLRAVNTDAIAETVILERIEEVDVEFEEDTERDTGASPTADLLEALRKRRTERDTTPTWLKEDVSQAVEGRDTEPVSMTISGDTLSIDDTITFTEPFEQPENEPVNDSKQVGKKGRTSLPSWDDIVFGTRSDDDPI